MKIARPIDTVPQPAVPPARGGVGAPVRLSATVLLEGLAERSGFDAEKVRAIRQAIDDGSFRVDADVIAERLIAQARSPLPGRVPH